MLLRNVSKGRWAFWCPGCEMAHVISDDWRITGTPDAPTIEPSVLVFGHVNSPPFKDQPRCHSFVQRGQIRYLSDCEHKLTGQVVPMVEFPDGGEP